MKKATPHHLTRPEAPMAKLKQLFLGRPIPTIQGKHERLSKKMGLAIFSSDALSSVAYATEEILLVLTIVGSMFFNWSIPIGLAIVVLLAIVATSYRQTIHAYPSGGGAYIVAKENLGTYPGQIAGAALLIDYILTVAVSISAGVAAITSAFPSFYHYRVPLGVILIAAMTLANLRGVRESGRIFSIPVYIFLISFFGMIGLGLLKYFLGQIPAKPSLLPNVIPPLGILFLLRAFASGCTALTGIEAISNGIPAFKPPEAKNAAITLTWMALILGSLFLGITFLANAYQLMPREGETLVSQLARNIFGPNTFYYLVQVITALILIIAANTCYADFPRLSSLLARDGFLPRQLANLGDRLVFSNGIIVLGTLASLMIIIFRGHTHALIPLYAVGVFLSFTLSQAGMTRKWMRDKTQGWLNGVLINGIGAITTGTVLIIIASTKFIHGAWITLFMLYLMVVVFQKIKSHYREMGKQLSLDDAKAPTPFKHTVLVPISGVHKGVVTALQYACSLSPYVRAVYVNIDAEATQRVRDGWGKWSNGIPLVVLESPYRSILWPLLDYVDQVQAERDDDLVTIIIPEFIPVKWWHHLLHNQTALIIKWLLMFKKGVVITNVPYHLER